MRALRTHDHTATGTIYRPELGNKYIFPCLRFLMSKGKQELIAFVGILFEEHDEANRRQD